MQGLRLSQLLLFCPINKVIRSEQAGHSFVDC